MRIASYQQRLANLNNQRVKSRTFLPGELVLRRVFENKANPADEKFQPNWKGPYTSSLSSDSRVLCVKLAKRDYCAQDVECYACDAPNPGVSR